MLVLKPVLILIHAQKQQEGDNIEHLTEFPQYVTLEI